MLLEHKRAYFERTNTNQEKDVFVQVLVPVYSFIENKGIV
jgi:hypothetical protein